MKWDLKSRIRLANMVWEKSKSITDMVRANNLDDFQAERNRLQTEYFEKVGFKRSLSKEWKLDGTPHHPQLFLPSRTHLFFVITTHYVMKVPKCLAKKMIVLGLP